MKSGARALGIFEEHVLPWAILVLLLTYTFGRFLGLPYEGFSLSAEGRVVGIFVQGNAQNPLQVGDQLVRVGSLSWVDFTHDYTAVLFDGVKTGEKVPLVVERAGAQLTIPWTYPGRNPGELLSYALSGFWLGYVFWFAGVMTAAHVRPKGEAWRIALAFNYFNAIASMFAGDAFFSHFWYSAYLFRMAVWVGLPLYLHFHWFWPRPLGKLPVPVIWAGYGAAVVLVVGEWLRLVPAAAYLAGIIVVITGCLILLALHFILQRAATRELRRFMGIVGLALVPVLSAPFLITRASPAVSSSIPVMGMPLIPLIYFAAARRGQLGEVEIRINRMMSVYAFLLLLGVVLLPLLTLVALSSADTIAVLVLGTATGVASAVAAIFAYPVFQAFMERRVLNLPVASGDLVGTYAARITGCTSLPELAALLRGEVLPSLLIRQFAFLWFDEGRSTEILVTGLEQHELPDAPAVGFLLRNEGKDRRASISEDTLPYWWIRVAIPLRIHGELIAAWLLGARDPDNTYSDSDIAVIQSLADQTAVALSNMIQAQRLRELYQANVTRAEEGRLRLALRLHDSILNHMAAMLMKLDGPSITPAFQESFEELSNRVREIVTDLRPPMLAYGLKPALEELAETLGERSDEAIRLSLVDSNGEVRYAPEVELHLFRIVQESCENALRHGRAATISITGRLDPVFAELLVADDGVGFDVPTGVALESLLARKHFGLAGLMERASLIGGTVQIQSKPGEGTRILVNWSDRTEQELLR